MTSHYVLIMTSSRAREKRPMPTLENSATFQRTATRQTNNTDDVTSPEPPSAVTSAHYQLPTQPPAPPTVSNTYRLKPEVKFKTSAVKKLTSSLLEERLRDVTYEPYRCKALGQELAAAIMEKVKALDMRRYKTVAIVSIGSNNERSGIQFGSRCLWDKETDSFITVKFSNQTLFAVAMVYGLYYE